MKSSDEVYLINYFRWPFLIVSGLVAIYFIAEGGLLFGLCLIGLGLLLVYSRAGKKFIGSFLRKTKIQ